MRSFEATVERVGLQNLEQETWSISKEHPRHRRPWIWTTNSSGRSPEPSTAMPADSVNAHAPGYVGDDGGFNRTGGIR